MRIMMTQTYSTATENYLRAIAVLREHGNVTNARIAAHLCVTPAAVTEMLQRLACRALAVYTPYHGVSLTEQGHQVAMTVLRRYRLLTLFLVNALDCPWDEVAAEADALEHVLSPRLAVRIAAYLGHPTVDVYGDPIPQADGTLPVCVGVSLNDFPLHHAGHIVRMIDQQPEHLRSCAAVGLVPGASIVVHTHTDGSDSLSLSVCGVRQVLDIQMARTILVQSPVSAP